jgi:CHAT domain-containing protein/Tfp pilus assembly protein PilF
MRFRSGRRAVILYMARNALLLSALFFSGSMQAQTESHHFAKIAELRGQGRHAEIIKLLEPLPTPGVAALNDLCQAYLDARRFDAMSACFAKLEKMSVNGRFSIANKVSPQYTFTMDVTNNIYTLMADGYLESGDYDKAISNAKQALAQREHAPTDALNQALNDSPTSKSYALRVLGIAYAYRGDLELARSALEQLEAVPATSNVGAVSDDFVKSIHLHELYAATRDYAAALREWDKIQGHKIQRDFEADPAMFGQDGLEFSRAHNTAVRAGLLLELGRVDEARQAYDTAMAHPRFKDTGAVYWVALYNRGRIADKDAQAAEAIRLYQRAIEVIEQERALIRTETAKIGFVGNKQDVYGALVKVLIGAGRHRDAFEYVERAKARALVDMLASRQQFATPANASPDTAAALASYTQLSREVAASAGKPVDDALRQTRGSLDSATLLLQKAAPELASLVRVNSISESQVRGLLQSDETLVEFFYQGSEWYAFVMTKAGLRSVKLDGAGLADAVRAYRALLQNPQSKNPAMPARQLHARLFASLGLPPQGKLLIVPHGVLHYLPFNALHDGKNYLVDRYSIRVLPSASVLTFLHQRKSKGKSLLIFGNPDLGDPRADLPGAQKEAMEIAQMRPGSTLLMRAAATKSAAQSLGPNFAYLHFASHGTFNAEKPLQSGLFLAPDRTSGADGMLTVGDL